MIEPPKNRNCVDRFISPGIYLHIPFCLSKCAYCDFVSNVFPVEIHSRYLAALKDEFKKRRKGFPDGFQTIYVGGGSPSSLNGDQWSFLVELLQEFAKEKEYCEFTIEMNPSQVTEKKISSLEGLVTRISLGAQTFEPALRKVLGRNPTDPACIENAVEMIRGRFDLNIDLIHSIPGQTIESLERDLKHITELAVDHVSAYALMLENGTPLHKKVAGGEVQTADENFEIEALRLVRRRLEEHGFSQYEISNFAKPKKRCQHNLATWALCEYLGIGAGACSYISGERTQNESDVQRYIELINEKSEAISERETLDEKKSAGELAMLSLRTRPGICTGHFKTKTGFDPFVLFEEPIKQHTASGLLETTQTHIRLTEAGLDLADRVMMDFVL